VFLAASRARLFVLKVTRVLLGQTLIDRPRDHASGLMTELFNLCESRFAGRPLLAKAMRCQQRYQFI
jgi:hypothetical protein